MTNFLESWELTISGSEHELLYIAQDSPLDEKYFALNQEKD